MKALSNHARLAWLLTLLALLSGCTFHVHRSAGPSLSALISALGNQEIAYERTPGFSIAVVEGGRIVYAGGFGRANISPDRPANADTPYAIGSLSKQFTAACILLLAQEHKLSLDDRLSKYFPRFDRASQISLRNLLGQTSGLHNYPNPSEHAWPTKGRIAQAAILRILETDTLDFQPGLRYEYSNSNYAVLAAVVSRVNGEPYAAFLMQHLFRPLRMEASGSGEEMRSRERLAVPGRFDEGRFVASPMISLDLYSGAGSIVSTVIDMAKWDIALTAGAVVSKSSLHDMFTSGKLNNGLETGYGMGFVPDDWDGHRVVWHNGLTPGGGGYCLNAIFPDDRVAVVILSNGTDFRPEPERITRAVVRYLKR